MTSIPIAYFKSTAIRNVGKTTIIRYHEVRSNGTIKTIDTLRRSVKNNMSFGGLNYTLEVSTKEEYDKALKDIID